LSETVSSTSNYSAQLEKETKIRLRVGCLAHMLTTLLLDALINKKAVAARKPRDVAAVLYGLKFAKRHPSFEGQAS